MMAYGIILSGQCPDCHRHAGQAWCGATCASEPAYKGTWGPGRVAVVYDTPPPVPAALEAPGIPVVYIADGGNEGDMVTVPNSSVRLSKPVALRLAVAGQPEAAKAPKPAKPAGRTGKR